VQTRDVESNHRSLSSSLSSSSSSSSSLHKTL